MMIKVKIEGVVLDLKSNLPIIVLKDEKNRVLPITVGLFEAQSIAFAMEAVRIPRPLTHDLIKNIFQKLGVKLMRVEITELKGGTYFAHLVIKAKTDEKIIMDSRPSDAIAIALRLKAPIYVLEELLIAKNIFSKPITDKERKEFKDEVQKLKPQDIWKELKRAD